VEQLLIFYEATVALCFASVPQTCRNTAKPLRVSLLTSQLSGGRSELPQSLRCVYAKPLRVIESLTNELEAYTSERKIGLLRLVRLILTTDY